MDRRERELIQELVDALEREYRECHSVVCGVFPVEDKHDCIHPKPKELLKWQGNDKPKCEFCGANRPENKPWQIYCSGRCNSAAYRKRRKEAKKLEEASV